MTDYETSKRIRLAERLNALQVRLSELHAEMRAILSEVNEIAFEVDRLDEAQA